MSLELSRLSLTSVSKRFGDFTAVDAVSLSVAPGEVVCLLGPSGCGKSTTLRLAAGFERSDSGTILVDDAVVDSGRRYVAPEHRRVGLMFQDFALFPHLNVLDNIGFGLRRASSAERRRIAAGELERVGLSHLAEAYPHELSGGEQQRVALARALAPQPRVLLMDEPFSGLDGRLRETVRDETLATLKARNAAVLIVTHDPEEAMRVGDRLALMRKGRLVQIGRPDDLYDRPVDAAAAAFFSSLNVLHATIRDGRAETPFGAVPAPAIDPGRRVEIMLRPQALTLTAPDGARLVGDVIRAHVIGEESAVRVAVNRPDLSEAGETLVFEARSRARELPRQGERVGISADLRRALIFPCERPKTHQKVMNSSNVALGDTV
ncbi:MAG: ATP-binding cassette domain-containing protein [Alphaproteobacteria bacterium]|nr:ATP-binding cassette domain-containing protein [Alphaproteobacteria bacterium]